MDMVSMSDNLSVEVFSTTTMKIAVLRNAMHFETISRFGIKT